MLRKKDMQYQIKDERREDYRISYVEIMTSAVISGRWGSSGDGKDFPRGLVTL